MAIRTADDYARLPDGSLKRKPASISDTDIAKSYTPQGDKTSSNETSFFPLGDNLYEQVVIDGESAFIEFNCNNGENGVIPCLIHSGIKVIPLSSEEIALGAVKLPSGIAEYGDTLSLLKQIEDYIYCYLDISDSFRKFAAYYVLLSWLYDRFNTVPYLRFIGDTGCGKSRALDVCGGSAIRLSRPVGVSLRRRFTGCSKNGWGPSY